jgi:hypothetical protein
MARPSVPTKTAQGLAALIAFTAAAGDAPASAPAKYALRVQGTPATRYLVNVAAGKQQ